MKRAGKSKNKKVNNKNSFNKKYIFNVILIIILFLVISYYLQSNIEFFEDSIMKSPIGIIIYIIITIIAVVFAPINTLPLILVATSLWGFVVAAILSIIGWTIGSLIAFLIARKYGVPLIKKFIHLDEIKKIEKMVPKKNIFLSVVFLRMIIPVDILSYALGLFSSMSTMSFFIATLIGVTPFAFIFAYFSYIDFFVQLAVIAIVIIIILVGYMIQKKRNSR